MNILIVEDDSDMQKILKLYLQREGYQVNSVSNGPGRNRFPDRECCGYCPAGLDDANKKRNGNAERNQAAEYSG